MQHKFDSPDTSAEVMPYIAPSIMSDTIETAETLPDVQAVNDLLTQTQRMVRRRKRKFWTAFAAVEAAGLLPLTLYILPDYLRHAFFASRLFLFIVPLVFLALAFMLLTLFLPVKLDSDALMKLGGPKSIPTLLDAFTLNPTTKYRKSILRVLTVLLPQMQASDASLLTPRHRRIFNLWLTYAFKPTWFRGVESEFILALLKAYEQVGDAKAIPVVERLANTRPRNEHQRKIQQAAQECLPLLQAHVGGMDGTQTLLRASGPNTAAPDILLRPAAYSAPTREEELLRAVEREEGPPSA